MLCRVLYMGNCTLQYWYRIISWHGDTRFKGQQGFVMHGIGSAAIVRISSVEIQFSLTYCAWLKRNTTAKLINAGFSLSLSFPKLSYKLLDFVERFLHFVIHNKIGFIKRFYIIFRLFFKSNCFNIYRVV